MERKLKQMFGYSNPFEQRFSDYNMELKTNTHAQCMNHPETIISMCDETSASSCIIF